VTQQQEEIDKFKQYSILTKQDIQSCLKYLNQKLLEQAKTSILPQGYTEACLELVQRFEKKLVATPLQEQLELWWRYNIEFDEHGLRLYLEYSKYHIYSNGYSNRYCILILEEKAPLLTAEEFALKYGVEAVTIRQWIRRGKLPLAFKAGNLWQLPQLALVEESRQHSNHSYIWNPAECRFTGELELLNDFYFLRLGKEHRGPDYCLQLIRKGDTSQLAGPDREKMLNLTLKEKEAFELKLLEHPLIHSISHRQIRINSKQFY